MRNRQTIRPVVKHKLCTGCGTCAGVCPRAAIEMVVRQGRYVPRLDKTRCIQCGLCFDACPGHRVDFDEMSAELFGDIPHELALGRYLGCYSGHALDPQVRYDGASGGLVSALVAFALEEGLIDGALVTRMRHDDPLRPEAWIARTRSGILHAAGSKYCPVTLGTALAQILNSEGRYAVVGLPCHIQGLRKAEQCIPRLKEQIRYRISLACSLNYSFRGTERFLASRGIAPAAVDLLQYRGRGWPGTMLVRLRDGTEYTIPLAEFCRELAPHSLRRCTLCSDMLGELSDLTCGDAWLPDLAQTDRLGTSFVLSRTDAAEELLELAASRQAVELSDLSIEELLTSQGQAVFKKQKLRARMELFKLFGRSVPTYQQTLLPPTRADYVHSLKLYAARYVLSGHHRILRRFFRSARRPKPAAPQTPAPPTEALSRR